MEGCVRGSADCSAWPWSPRPWQIGCPPFFWPCPVSLAFTGWLEAFIHAHITTRSLSPCTKTRERWSSTLILPSFFFLFSSSFTHSLPFFLAFFLSLFFWVKCKNDIQQAGRDAAALVPMATLKPAFLAGFFTPPCVFFYSTGLGFRLQPCSKGPGTIPRGSH